MPNTNKIAFKETDNTVSPANPVSGVTGILGVAKRGPVNNTDTVFYSWAQFRKLHGGYISGNDTPLLLKRILDKGIGFRFCNVRHYTDITNPSTLTSVYATISNFTMGASNVFALPIKYPGADYNNIRVTLGNATNGDAKAFNILIEHLLEPELNENWENLSIQGNPTIANSNYLDKLAQGSQLVNPVYFDLSAIAGIVRPTNAIKTFAGGIDNNVTINPVTGVGATATYTQTVLGANGDGIWIPYGPINNLNAVYYVKGAGETTLAQEATAIAALINAQTPNNGFSASAAGAVVTITAPIVLGASLNGVQNTPYPSGAIMGTLSAWANGVTAVDGSTGVTDTDFIGDVGTNSGFHAFDSVDDIMELTAIGASQNVDIAGTAYAAARTDLQYFIHLSNDYVTVGQLIAARASMNIDSSYAQFFCGGVMVLDPLTNRKRGVSEIADVLAIANLSAEANGPWYSFAGKKRGTITDVLGVVNNFLGNDVLHGTAQLNQLANHQINAVVNKKGTVLLKGNFTGQVALSTLSFANVRRNIIYIKKLLAPIIEQYEEEPLDFKMMEALYYDVKPLLDGLVTKRALHDYSWKGDQFATDNSHLVINNTADLDLGKYKVKLGVKDIVSLQEIEITIELTPSGVSFSDNLNN